MARKLLRIEQPSSWSIIRVAATFLLTLLITNCSSGGSTEAPPPLTVTISAIEARRDSILFTVTTTRPASLNVTWAEGEGAMCTNAAVLANGRYVITPAKRGEVKYTVCATANASDGGTGSVTGSVTSAAFPDQCTDPLADQEYVNVTIRWVQSPKILTRTLDPVRYGVSCPDGTVRMYSAISSHIISTDGGGVYEHDFSMMVGSRPNVLAVGFFNDQTAKLERWLGSEGASANSEFTVRIAGQPASSGINLTGHLGKTIPHGCAPGNGCYDTDPWVLKLERNGSGGYVLSN
jgi:hypothetical protein